MLWLTGTDDGYAQETLQTLEHVGVAHERLSVPEIQDKFPQISTSGIEWAVWEPGSGVLIARRSVQALVAESERLGLVYRTVGVAPPAATHGKLGSIITRSGESIAAGCFVFACGAWLPKLFPDLLDPLIFPTRQEIFFFAPPPGDLSFSYPAMPAWYHHPALVYGIPDLEYRGFKVAVDRHGPAFDPDSGSRAPSAEAIALARDYIATRFPKLRDAPLCESRVCQYENTSNGDFIIDRHPEFDDVLIAGGGSGHGFKHGPAVGDYVCRVLTTSLLPEPRFALSAKESAQARTVY